MSDNDDIGYEKAKELARSEDVSVRMALAEREDLSPELLYFLAEDDAPQVRQMVAENAAAPRQTDLLLAKDTSAEVREGLAAKIAQVAPGLTPEETSKVRAQTYEALEMLARDQMVKVRAVLSEAIKDVTDAPSDIVNSLARDLAIEVSGPVLEHSPVLTDDDLIEIIATGPAQGGIAAIARRDGVSENLADAIIATDDLDGIGDLLDNGSAQIRESALDDLIDRSAEIEMWQAPLVKRPKLPDGAAERMAGFIADNFLDTMRQREDLDAETMAAVGAIVRDRLAGGGKKKKALTASFDFLKVATPIDAAQRLHDAKKLSDEMMAKAIQAGDHPFFFAGMLVRAGVEESVGRRIFNERSAFGIVALMGKAGLPGGLAVTVQKQMGRIAPSDLVEPDEAGVFPMTDDDIEWHLEFFRNMTDRG